ncbi:MAG: CPBP family intramembrane glutamic endopeptidase [Ruegeria sp.]
MAVNQVNSAYSAQEPLVAQARTYPEIWRLLAGLAIIAAVVLALNAGLFAFVSGMAPETWVLTLVTGSTPTAMLVLLSSFGFVVLGVFIAARQMQHRTLRSILGNLKTFMAQFWFVLRALLIVGVIVAVLPPYDMGAPLQSNLPLATWLAFLPLSVIAVLIQTSAEEVLFRGYLQQSLAARFQSPLVWLLVPAVLFAAGHYAPTEAGENAFLVSAWSFAFGVLAADLTARAGTLGPAIAMHFFNNVVALLFISLPDSLNGLALFLVPYDMSDTGILRQWLIVDFAFMIISWLTARLALRR